MMQPWFQDAKLGIFIHWGAYAIQRRGDESWPFFRGAVSYDEYMTQLEAFDPQHFDAEDWADLISAAGARYAVLTTKHHDGIALWPTGQDGPSIVNKRRETDPEFPDLVGSYLDAIRARGIKAGLYFSHTDWSHTGHMQVLMDMSEDELQAARAKEFGFRGRFLAGGLGDKPEHEALWLQFLDFHRAQLGEILGNYGDIDLLWFDVMMKRGDHHYRCEELRDFIHGFCDTTIINARLAGHGDYETPEQFIPIHQPKGPWEFCVTSNNTWSFTGREESYKTAGEIVRMFCECLGMGGNMLLNIGPDEQGRVPEQQRQLLLELGAWINRHEEAVYGTVAGLPYGYAYHFSSMSKERDVIYLYCAHDAKGNTPVKGLHNEVERVSVVGSGVACDHKRVGGAPWAKVPGVVHIEVPDDAIDPYATVLKIELDGPLDLYGGAGRSIDIN